MTERDESDRDVDLREVVEHLVTNPRRSPLDFTALALTAGGGMLLLAGILYAFAIAGARDVDGSERFRLLAQASSPFVAALVLAAVGLLALERRRADAEPWVGSRQVAGAVVMTAAAVVALVALLLAVNGIVVDLTAGGVGALFRVSNVIGRLATVALAGFALWLSATAPPPVRSEPPVLG